MKTIVFNSSNTPVSSSTSVVEINERIFRANERITTPDGENLLLRLLESFKDSSILFLSWIRDARENPQGDTLEQSLRMMRNSAVLIGAHRLSKLTSEYMHAVQEGEGFTSEDLDALSRASLSFCHAADAYITKFQLR